MSNTNSLVLPAVPVIRGVIAEEIAAGRLDTATDLFVIYLNGDNADFALSALTVLREVAEELGEARVRHIGANVR